MQSNYYFWKADGIAWLCARRFVQDFLVQLEQVILHGFNEKVFAARVALDEGLLLHPLNNVILRHQRQANMLQEALQSIFSVLKVMVDP